MNTEDEQEKGFTVNGTWCPQVSRGVTSCAKCSVYPVRMPNGTLVCRVCGFRAPNSEEWNRDVRRAEKRMNREREMQAEYTEDARGKRHRKSRFHTGCSPRYNPDDIGPGWLDLCDSACARRLGFMQADRRLTERGNPDVFPNG